MNNLSDQQLRELREFALRQASTKNDRDIREHPNHEFYSQEWKRGFDCGMKEAERMIQDLQKALAEEREARKNDNELFTNMLTQ